MDGYGFVDVVEDEIHFWGGSKIYLCRSTSTTAPRKLTHCTEAMYRFLRSRVRMVGLPVPAEYYLPRPNA